MIRDHRKPQCASAHGANALLLAMSSVAFLGLNYAATRFPLPAFTLFANYRGTVLCGEKAKAVDCGNDAKGDGLDVCSAKRNSVKREAGSSVVEERDGLTPDC